MKPLIPIENVNIYFDGTVTRPQLKHPECVAFDKDGNLWCGGDSGEIYRISKDDRQLEQIATTDGFILGMAFDSKGNLYICDMKFAKVFRLNSNTGELSDFSVCTGNQSMNSPNYPVIDEKRNVLYVSDSNELDEPAPSIWRFDLTTGEGNVWYDRPLNFANGLAMTKDGSALYIAETFGQQISKLAIHQDGNPGHLETIVQLPDAIPDGLVLDEVNQLLYICCYEPSKVYRTALNNPNDKLELLLHDRYATTLCHPTNGVIKESKFYLANLGRWHIAEVDLPR